VLCALDRSVTAHKAVPGSRAASTACGRRLLRLGCELAPDAGLLHAYAARVEDGEADGNVAVVTGALAHALAVPARVALVIELRAAAAALLTAAVRLGRLAATRAQVLLRRLDADVAEAAAHCHATMRHPFTSTTPELDIAGLAHHRLAGRQFAS
jgi:urease accessory protein